jgi:hypothetical protein
VSLTPAQILGIGTKPGQAHFNIGIGRPTGHTDYTLQQLEAGYASDPEFVALPTGAVRLRVRCDAQKTSSKTKYARVELRETDAAGQLFNWDGRKGTHWCEWVSRVTHLPKVKPWVVVGQIHDAKSDLVRVQTEGSSVDALKLVSRNTPPGSKDEQTVTVDSSYTLGDLVVGRLEVVDGVGREYLDGKLVRTFPAASDGQYFKVGAYVQSQEAGEYAEVELLGVRHWHTGWPTPISVPVVTTPAPPASPADPPASPVPTPPAAPSTPPAPTTPPGPVPAPTDVLVIIRHAEKPVAGVVGVTEAGKSDSHSLIPAGWARAGAIATLVTYGLLPRPARIYASKGTTSSMRPLQTILFLARLLKLTPITKFDVEAQVAATAAELNAQHGVSWLSMEHSAIVALLKALDVTLREWPDARFDIALVLVRTATGWNLTQVPQRLLPGDLETAI